MSAVDDAMKKLTEQWYNALVTGLGLDQSEFQLFQGTTSLGTSDDEIWRFFDSIPPVSVNNYYNPSTANSLAQAYGGVINNLIPQNENDMQVLLKNNYMSWLNFAKDVSNLPNPLPKTANGELDVVGIQVTQFQTWGLTNGIDSSTINAGVTLIKQVDVVSAAITKWTAANGVYAYTASQNSLSIALQTGHPKNATLNSVTTSSNVSNSWAKASASGAFDFFSASASTSWDRFTADFSGSTVGIDVEFANQTTLVGGPYANKAPTNVNLENYSPWWNGSTLQTAKENNNNTVWKHTAPTWEQAFGPNGNLLRLANAIVVVDGIKSTLTSSATVAQSERDDFSAAVSGGFWPFFSASASGGWSHETHFNDDGTFSITSESPTGNPTVLGVMVSPIDTVF